MTNKNILYVIVCYHRYIRVDHILYYV